MAIIHSPMGTLQGLQGRGVVHFRGIPYAAATRFGPPVEVPGWTGLRDATRHGPIAPQPPSRLRAAMGDAIRPMDEDCLTLTIATPSTEGRHPVIVFLHGGAYWTGAGSLDWYDGATLAAENGVVVVGVNYRLGALGFLAHPALCPGNRGHDDMVAALRWVRANITAFGGDPDSVTLVGQSAGAHAIQCLLGRADSEGLFHRGVMMSGIARMPPRPLAEAARGAEAMAAHLNLPVGGLASAPVSALIEAGLALARAGSRFGDITPPFLPTAAAAIDAETFLAAAARAAAARKVDLVIGTTHDEMHAFFAPDPAFDHPDPARVAAIFTQFAGSPESLATYRARRPLGTLRDHIADLVTDHMFLFPALALAQAVQDAGGQAHLYRFDWTAPGNPFKACHCIDLPFLFGNFAAWPDAAMLKGGDADGMTALSRRLRAVVAGFARGGAPGEATPMIFV